MRGFSPSDTSPFHSICSQTDPSHPHKIREVQRILHSLAHCLLVGRAYGLTVLDGVHLDLSDDEGFAAVCQQAAEMGFDGKTLIHPKTIDAANAAFAPSVEEVEWSRRVIAAHTEATAQGQGVVLVDGQLIENLHMENAQRIVRIAEAIHAMASA